MAGHTSPMHHQPLRPEHVPRTDIPNECATILAQALGTGRLNHEDRDVAFVPRILLKQVDVGDFDVRLGSNLRLGQRD